MGKRTMDVKVEPLAPIEGDPKKWFKITQMQTEICNEDELRVYHQTTDEAVRLATQQFNEIDTQMENKKKLLEEQIAVNKKVRDAFAKHLTEPAIKEDDANE